ncbi:hypothetical protein [Burkholderia gladioli]|uniref:hypothetical protein n=1 Tax=Burkholderia gladioli TaxID=28095 RepID=UPI003EE28C66
MKRTFLVRALLGAAIPMMMAEDVPAATQAAPEGGAPAGESALGAAAPDFPSPVFSADLAASLPSPAVAPSVPSSSSAFAPDSESRQIADAQEAGGAGTGEPVASPVPDVTGTDSFPAAQASSPADARSAPPSSIASESDSTVLRGTDAPAVAPVGESVAGALTPISGDTTANTSGSGTGVPAPDSSSSATTTLSTAAVPGTSSTAAPPDQTTVELSSGVVDTGSATSLQAALGKQASALQASLGTQAADLQAALGGRGDIAPADAANLSGSGAVVPNAAELSASPLADATLADAGGIPPTPAPALDPALGQIPAPPSVPPEPADPPADEADAAASPLMFEIHSVTENVPPIRIYADGHVDGLPAGYQLVINRGQAVAAELENLKADDRHLSLLASWHKEMEVLGRGLSGEVTRLLGETKKYLEDVL